jgi:ADP-ribose pyrophosphatase YjhB (NUDIX family)
MSQLRVLTRTLVIDNSEILLVRNKDANFWYPPGGGWEYEHETITECAAREVSEETGYKVTIDRLLWLQEFHTEGKIFFETFWLAKLDTSNTQSKDQLAQHIDLDPSGMVEEARWYTQDELSNLKVFPKRIKTYQDYIKKQAAIPNPFIGTFK